MTELPLREKFWRAQITKAQNEGSNSPGGFLVPNEVASEIIRQVEVYGVARANAQIARMGSDNQSWPKRVTGMTAPTWTAENASLAESSNMSFEAINLVAKKLAVYIRASSEVLEDSAASLADYISTEAAFQFAKEEDRVAFNGTGIGTDGNIRGITTLINNTATGAKIAAGAAHNQYSTLDNADFANTLAGVPAAALPNAKWYISHFGFATAMARLAGVSGGPIGGYAFMGFPVVPTATLPQTNSSQTGNIMVLFGDMSRTVLFGDKREVSVKVTSSRYMDSDQIGFRITERLDIVAHGVGDTTALSGFMAGLVGTA